MPSIAASAFSEILRATTTTLLATTLAATLTGQYGLVDSTATTLVPPLATSYYPGAAWGDVDGDGWQDLYVTNYYGPNHLFLNRPAPSGSTGRRLVDLTPTLLMDTAGHGEGAALADFDNDGDLDLYVTNAGGAPNKLFANLGGGAWADASAGSGVAYAGMCEGCAVADWDTDGDLDIYLLNYGATSAGELHRWFRNDGGLLFTDVTTVSLGGLGPTPGGACAFADYDLDGDLDLFVGNDGAANRLMENRGAAGFVNVASAVGGTALLDPAGGCFGVRWVDYDADGDFDLYLSNSSTFHGMSSMNRMFRNDAAPLGGRVLVPFTSGAEDTGSGMAVTGGDLDRDGTEDLAIANFGTNKVYTHTAATSLFHYTPAPSTFFSDPVGDTSSSATRCDFDKDGDLDVFFGGTFLAVFQHTGGSTGTISTVHRTVTVRFLGDDSAPFAVPRDGSGTRARLWLRIDGTVTALVPRALQQVDGGSGYAQDAPECFWALNPTHPSFPLSVNAMNVTWANGLAERLTDLPTPSTTSMHKRLSIHYPAGISDYGALAITGIRLERSSIDDDYPTARLGALNFALATTGLLDGSFGLLAVGLAPASIPTPFGTLLVDPLLTLGVVAVGGTARWSLAIPASTAWLGAPLHAQCFVIEPAGTIRASQGKLMVVQP